MGHRMTLTVLASITFPLLAQPVAGPAAPYAGRVVGENVYVRSAPEQYPCLKLSTPATVQVLGEAFGWLKIAPPAGSFSLVAKQYVVPSADGSAGTIKGTNVNVRAGSAIHPTRADHVQTRLNTGDKVAIVGECTAKIAGTEYDFYRIKPPAKAVLWMAAKYVKPAAQSAETPVTPVARPTTRSVAVAPTTGPTTRPAGENVVTATRPVGQISREVAALQLAEKALEAENAKPREERNLPKVLALYKAIPLTPSSPLASLVNAQIKSLQTQLSLNDDLKEATELLAEVAAQQERLKLAARNTDIKLAAARPVQASAEGVLRQSYLYRGGIVGKRYLVRAPDEAGQITYVQCTTGLVDLRKHLGEQVRVLGVSRFDAKLPAHVIEVEELNVLAPAPKVLTTRPADTDHPTPEPKAEPAPAASSSKDPSTQPVARSTPPAALPVVRSVTAPKTGVDAKEYE